ncbi:MAG: T9SS type A sorting domain-containing protein [Bacteroidota bacterium]
MKNTLRSFLIIIFLISGVNSFADKKSNDSYVCPTASISYTSIKFCNSETNIQAVNLTGTDAYLGGVFTSMPSGLDLNPSTGAITPNTSTPGIYTIEYTIPAGPGCPGFMVTTNVEIVGKANAGIDGSMAICGDTTVIDLFMLITGEQAGGTWSRTSGSGGTFNAAAGTFTPAIGTTYSTFIYTVSGSVPCSADSSVATIMFNDIPTGISISGSTTTCAGTPVNLTVTGTPGSIITWTTDMGVPNSFVIGGSGSIIIPVTPTVSTTYNLTSAILNSCSIPLTGSATVIVSTTPQFITQIQSFAICNGGTLNLASQLTSTIPGSTFIWSATSSNLTGFLNSGNQTNIDQIVNLANTSSNGSITLEIKAFASGCYSTSQFVNISVNPDAYAGTDGSTTICDSSFTTINLHFLITGEQSGGTWTRTGGSGGTFNAAAGTFTPAFGATPSYFIYVVSTPCSTTDSSMAIVNINPQPIAGLDGSTSVSEASTTPVDLFSLITGEQAGGVWIRTTGTGGTFNAGAGTFTPAIGATSSTFMYSLTGTAPCVNDVSMATINIDVVPVGMANTSNQTISNTGFSNIILSSSNVPTATFTWTFTANNISGASNGSGTTISQQLSLIDPNLDGYVDYNITPVNNSADGSSFAARVSIQSLLDSETFIINSVKLSPNPVTDILNIENDYQINSIKIYNQLGQMVFGKEINNNTTQLDLSVINSGIYNVLIETEKGLVNHKIVKK